MATIANIIARLRIIWTNITTGLGRVWERIAGNTHYQRRKKARVPLSKTITHVREVADNTLSQVCDIADNTAFNVYDATANAVQNLGTLLVNSKKSCIEKLGTLSRNSNLPPHGLKSVPITATETTAFLNTATIHGNGIKTAGLEISQKLLPSVGPSNSINSVPERDTVSGFLQGLTSVFSKRVNTFFDGGTATDSQESVEITGVEKMISGINTEYRDTALKIYAIKAQIEASQTLITDSNPFPKEFSLQKNQLEALELKQARLMLMLDTITGAISPNDNDKTTDCLNTLPEQDAVSITYESDTESEPNRVYKRVTLEPICVSSNQSNTKSTCSFINLSNLKNVFSSLPTPSLFSNGTNRQPTERSKRGVSPLTRALP